MKWIIIDTRTKKALYGVDNITLNFSSRIIAEEVAIFFFRNNSEYIIIPILINYYPTPS